jgi:hypothetical protein
VKRVFFAERFSCDSFDPAPHFDGRASRKSHQKDAARVRAIDD